MVDSPFLFAILTNNITWGTSPHIVVKFLLVPIHWQEKCRVKENKIRNTGTKKLQAQGKNKIWCYPKYILIFTAYQVQERWNMILNPVKHQLDGIHVREIVLKSSWYTHIKHSKPYTFILQKVKKPPDLFCTHLFFDSAMIIIFIGLFLHHPYSIIKVNIGWLRVRTTDFSMQKCRTRSENSNSSKPSWKVRKKPPQSIHQK